MSIEALKEKLPEYARDQQLNLAALVMDTLLSEQQRWGTLVATALASRNRKVIAAIVDEAKEHLSPEALEAAKAAASIMAMNNIYFRFVHMALRRAHYPRGGQESDGRRRSGGDEEQLAAGDRHRR